MNKNAESKEDLLSRLDQMTIVRVIRDGLVHIIPVLIIGAFALIIKTFPVDAYLEFIETFAGGFILKLAEVIYSATFGVLSVYMTYSISRAYMRVTSDYEVSRGGAIIASLASFFILSGAYLEDFSLNMLGPKSMFLAIITGMLSSWLYCKLDGFFRKKRIIFYSAGADRQFNRMVQTFIPVVLVSLIFAVINTLIVLLFDTSSARELLITAANKLFSFGEVGFFKGFFFVLLSSLLWFFGIHGSDTLEGVMETYFTPNLIANQMAITSGGNPSNILTKEFFDCFVLIGGCGTTISLLIAILIFSRNSARRSLGLAATFPMIFNINELMVFGLPIIFNPIMLIPFLATPLVCYSLAYAAIYSGIVPMITAEVAWTTPVILGGYTATGSMMGAVLQIVNLALGVAIYAPFVRILDKRTAREMNERFEDFMSYYFENEAELVNVKITELNNIYGETARELSADLKRRLKKEIVLFYQPQYRYDGTCLGGEALLRCSHPVYGTLFPPLVIKLAEEGGYLTQMEELVFEKALKDRPLFLQKFGEDAKLSVNVTGTTVVTPEYLQFLREINEKDPFEGKNICLEITEQATLLFNENTIKTLEAIKSMGIMLAIDDFSMGQTSINYLKNNLFDVIKLDGSLVKGLLSQQNCSEIISSITQLADALSLSVLAEYVETEEYKEKLHEIGCDNYQGYLYSKAVPLEAGEN